MKMLITAGPTREPIDAVRFISNRSSGQMGLAIAQAAAEAGHHVTLLYGPGVDVRPLEQKAYRGRCDCFDFGSSTELKQVLEAHWPGHDCLVMAAAVADYRPMEVAEGKLPRDPHGRLVLELQPTPDLVALAVQSRRPRQKVVAFALEPVEELEPRAIAKLQRKGVDAIIANPLGAMESSGVTAIWLTAAGLREAPGRMSKTDFAHWLIPRLEKLAS
jgi:phosphopantothenoylcysteine decarboxylase/phosphopantothenate--cysteine ligase